ncbi:hypothetical protein J6590_094144 [Homalodisca vitripennis]|nr:hypothetical protein J6590_094144 [Homalodisca vitripennis]
MMTVPAAKQDVNLIRAAEDSGRRTVSCDHTYLGATSIDGYAGGLERWSSFLRVATPFAFQMTSFRLLSIGEEFLERRQYGSKQLAGSFLVVGYDRYYSRGHQIRRVGGIAPLPDCANIVK